MPFGNYGGDVDPYAADPFLMRARCLQQAATGIISSQSQALCRDFICDDPFSSADLRARFGCPEYTIPVDVVGNYPTPPPPPVTRDTYDPPRSPSRETRDTMGAFLPGLIGNRNDLLRRVAGGLINTFLPGPQERTGPCQPGDTRLECMFYGPPITPVVQTTGPAPSTAMTTTGCRGAGRYRQPAQCYVQSRTGRKFRGSYKVVNGQVVCCPKRRAINPMNGRAAMRAARRLKGVFKFQRRVEKALQRACRGSGVRRAPARRAAACRKCA